MEISLLPDTISSISYSAQSLSFSNSLLNRTHTVFSFTDTSSDQKSPIQISAASPPPTRTLTKRRLRKTRRVKRKIAYDNDGGENGYFLFGTGFGDGDGYFGGGGGGGGGGGKGWNFGGYGGDSNWGEFPENSVPDPAFDVVYEVLCWIAMSNCLHYAYKKVVRSVAVGFGDREKVQLELTPVC